MTTERRYRDDEIRWIFEEALRADAAGIGTSAQSGGLTLHELQDVAREVGVAPERIAAAARSLEARPETVPPTRLLGKAISTGLIVELPRAPTDREWEVLVAELRQTFVAEGRVQASGGARRWSNGNLVAVIEPTDRGFRLRMGTRKSSAISLDLIGFGLLAMGLLVLARVIGGGGPDDAMAALLTVITGAGLFGYNAYRLPRWAAEREGQMRYIADRTLALVGPAESPSPNDASLT